MSGHCLPCHGLATAVGQLCIPVLQVDMCSMEEVDEIARRPNSIPISCSLKLNMDGLLERIWEMMALVRRL